MGGVVQVQVSRVAEKKSRKDQLYANQKKKEKRKEGVWRMCSLRKLLDKTSTSFNGLLSI